MSLLSVFENSVRLPAEHTGIFFFTKLLIVSFPLAPFHSTVFSSLVGHPPPRFLTAQHTGWWWSLWRRRLRNKKKRCLKFFSVLFFFFLPIQMYKSLPPCSGFRPKKNGCVERERAGSKEELLKPLHTQRKKVA